LWFLGALFMPILAGLLTVSSGQTSNGYIIVSGGHEIVLSGGKDVSATLSSGGLQELYGVASGTTISSGGAQYVFSGGAASGVTVNSGGFQEVGSGGTATDLAINGSAIISGGTVELASGAVANGAITLTSGGTLLIDGTAMPSAVISGFAPSKLVNGSLVGDAIDLAGVSFASGGSIQLMPGNVLQLVEKGNPLAFLLQLDPSQNFSGDSFKLTSGAGGGTEIQIQSGLSINISYDSSVSSAPSGFIAAINYVVALYEKDFSNAATINIDAGYGEISAPNANTPLDSGNLGQSYFYYGPTVSYAQARQALIAEGAPGADTLPATNPFDSPVYMVTAQEKALGLLTASSQTFDGYVGFSNTHQFSFTPNQAVSNQYYFIGSVEHEISEVMGRFSSPNYYSAMDLYRYASSGVRQLGTGAPSYFSIDGGATSLDPWNNYTTGNSGDLGDWAPGAGADAFLDNSYPGTLNEITPADLTLMQAIGWTAPAILIASGTFVVSSGQSSNGLAIQSGGTVTVLSGGVATNTKIGNGGLENVYGSAFVTVNSGVQYVYGSAFSTRIVSGGQQLVFGGTTTGTTVSSGGYDYIGAGGTANGATVDSGGAEFVAAGGSASGTTVSGGGNQYVSSGGVVSSTIISSGGFATVYSGGTANGTTVSSGGVDYVLSGGSASGMTIGISAVAIVYGTVSGTTVSSGGYDYVGPGGKASGTTLASGGDEFVGAGGTAVGTRVGSGGAAFAQSGGTVSGIAVSSGGYGYVQSGGRAVSATLSGGVEYVLSGGKTSGTTIGKGGVLVVYGAASGTQANSGGYDLVGPGGSASGTNVSGGAEYVLSGGTTIAATITSGQEVLFGIGSGTTLNNGASEFVSSGATALATLINSGGIEYVFAGATASGAHLNGGTQIDYGTAVSTIITGGTQDVEAGGTANATTLSGGFEDVLSAGAASGTIIKGGYEYVFAGGTASATIISAGTFEIASGGSTGTGPITFSGGGTLLLDDAVHFGGLVAGFNVPADRLDLLNIAYISGTTTSSWTQLTSGANASGTLTITDGTSGTTANITLLGQYAAGNFHVTSDGLGGTLVTDPPVATAMIEPPTTAVGWNQHA
jgi:autotransporter passenger strand-loop-strand repeat protein